MCLLILMWLVGFGFRMGPEWLTVQLSSIGNDPISERDLFVTFPAVINRAAGTWARALDHLAGKRGGQVAETG